MDQLASIENEVYREFQADPRGQTKDNEKEWKELSKNISKLKVPRKTGGTKDAGGSKNWFTKLLNKNDQAYVPLFSADDDQPPAERGSGQTERQTERQPFTEHTLDA